MNDNINKFGELDNSNCVVYFTETELSEINDSHDEKVSIFDFRDDIDLELNINPRNLNIDELCLICLSGSTGYNVGKYSRYIEYINQNPRFMVDKVKVLHLNTTYLYHNGQIISTEPCSEDEFFDNLKSIYYFNDFFDGQDCSKEISYIIEEYTNKLKKLKELENIDGLTKITSSDIKLLKTNPQLYKLIKIDKKVKKLSLSKIEIEEKYLFYSIYNPDILVEHFTIVEKEPSSDMMIKYLTKFADLITEEMNEKEEISDIESLKKLAYDYSGYRESIESVEIMAKEFDDYFRYLLIKDDNILITKEKADELKKLADNIKNTNTIRECSIKTSDYQNVYIDYKFTSDKLKDYPYIISDSCDVIKYNLGSSKNVNINIFKKIDKNLIDFPKEIDDDLSNRMAILHEIVTNGSETKKITVNANFIVVDKNNLCYVFNVKNSTLKKWKQSLYKDCDKAFWHINNHMYQLPYDFMNVGVTI